MTASDAADNQNPTQDVTGPLPAHHEPPSTLDRRIDFGRLGWYGVWAAIAIAVATLLRFVQLDAYVLTQREGTWAYDAWSLYTGKPLPAGQSLPLVSPLFMLLQTATYFLFGVTDAIARSGPAIVGIGLVALTFAFRPMLSRASVIGMALLAAVAPTLVFASRTIDPAILIAFFSLLAVVAILRAGAAFESRAAWWAAVFGGSLAAMIASGPEGISSIIAIGVALAVASVADSRRDDDGQQGPVAAGLAAIMSSSRGLAGAVAAFVIVTLLAFSRLLSEASALEGFLITFRDWGRMMATQTSTTPTQFFFYAALLYELAAVIFAIVALTSSSTDREDDAQRRLQPTLFATWFVVALVLQSLASGRQADQTVLVTLPLVLLGGIGLGRIITRIRWRTLANTRDGLILAAMFGLFLGIVGVITLIARTNDTAATNTSSPWLGVIFIVFIVVVPFTYLIARESTRAHYPRYAGWCALLALTVLLGIYTIRTTTQLAWVRADTGVEMIAQRVPTQAVRSFVDQTLRLSRDLSVTEVSNIDNTGSFGLNIAIDPAIDDPFMWYFRDFPNVTVTSPAGWGDADMVIAPTKEGMEDNGYIVQSRSWLNRVPPEFESLSLGSVFSTVFSPSEWYDGFRFIFFRELDVEPVPEQVSVGYTFRLSNQMNPSAGPFDLQTGQSLGPGTSLGQVNGPTGITLSNDGQTIYVVDAGNQRIQRFSRDGAFLGAWSAEDDQRIGLGWFDPASQGASDIIVGPEDNLIYIADTWNHRIMVLDADGNLVRELGRSGEITDTGNATDPSVSPGLFYGPRSLAIADGELYVTDTGNERVQVFASDGTFLRAFGGAGSEPGQLLEPVGIAIGPDGNVYVADTGNARISVFNPQGEPVTQIPMPNWEGQIGQQSYLRFDANGILYVTTPTNGTIQAWNGTDFVTIQGEGEGSAVTAPAGMAIDQNGILLVTETSTSRIVQFPIALPEGFAASPGGATPGASPVASPVTTEGTPAPDEASPPAVG